MAEQWSSILTQEVGSRLSLLASMTYQQEIIWNQNLDCKTWLWESCYQHPQISPLAKYFLYLPRFEFYWFYLLSVLHFNSRHFTLPTLLRENIFPLKYNYYLPNGNFVCFIFVTIGELLEDVGIWNKKVFLSNFTIYRCYIIIWAWQNNSSRLNRCMHSNETTK